MPFAPLSINYEPNSSCNLDCVMCNRARFFDGEYRVDAVTFSQWYDQVKPAFVALHGYGEPLLNTDLFSMLAYAKQHGSRTTITSNFILLNGRAEKLVSCGLDLLKISLDATDAETYQAVRRSDSFVTVMENIRELVRVKREKSSAVPEIRINFTISRFNVHQIGSIIRLASENGVQSICFAVLLFKDSMLENRDSVGDIGKNEFIRMIDEGIRAERETGCVTNLRSIRRDFPFHLYAYDKNDPDARKNRRRCLKPWITSFVSSNGDVKPCDLLGLTGTVMGNLHERPFREIWNNDVYRAFRNEIRSGRRPNPICADCFPMGISDFFEYRNVSKNYLTE
ncbi:MAG: SPASM domain-containing protein [Chitinispirillaceae bacterium]|nr:SPASM domain-containing protein [Chitinispirillaceae bacterium]